ncbi:putative non-specific lipid-transfer protein [Acorus calamus]|uniref:Non-specific lipid-transfer protein n=1 Tax=Acorus calamus TaxID=4465 RepID=A0AAV9DMI0_ACOCL|nr:putative non-specific lipid-transfer protein [Acorus calamus]
MKNNKAALLLLSVALALLVAHVPMTVSVTCDPNELSSCLLPILFGTTPSTTCCQKLREQQPCFCEYIANPDYQGYITSPNALKPPIHATMPFH